MPKCHLDEWQLFYDKYFFATRSWMINASPEGHLAKAVTAFLLFIVGNSMDNSVWRAHFFPEGINEILLVASPANSKATTRMSQTQTFSYKPQLFPFPKVPMDRINPVGAAHPSPKGHTWTMLPKDWQEKRAGGWVIFQRGSSGNWGCHSGFSNISYVFSCLICPGKWAACCSAFPAQPGLGVYQRNTNKWNS